MAAAPEPSDDEPQKVNPFERAVWAVDAFQQRTFPLNFLFGVVKKFGDDSAGSQAALIAYYGFLSIFPLLLVMVTLLSIYVSPGTEHRIVHSALSQFPIVGNQLSGPNGIHRLKSGAPGGDHDLVRLDAPVPGVDGDGPSVVVALTPAHR